MRMPDVFSAGRGVIGRGKQVGLGTEIVVCAPHLSREIYVGGDSNNLNTRNRIAVPPGLSGRIALCQWPMLPAVGFVSGSISSSAALRSALQDNERTRHGVGVAQGQMGLHNTHLVCDTSTFPVQSD